MKKTNSIPLTIVTVLISIATSWGIIQAKVNAIEKAADKNERTLDDLQEFRAEQRTKMDRTNEDLKELKSDMKEILKVIREK